VSKIIEWLQIAGYRATAIENGRGVSSGTNGLTFVIFAHDKSIQFYMGMALTDKLVTFEECNKINRDWRYLKVTLDDESDPAVEMDITVDFSSNNAKDTFSEALGIWDAGLGRVKQWLLELSERNAQSAPGHGN
jgi:hypothetical protein